MNSSTTIHNINNKLDEIELYVKGTNNSVTQEKLEFFRKFGSATIDQTKTNIAFETINSNILNMRTSLSDISNNIQVYNKLENSRDMYSKVNSELESKIEENKKKDDLNKRITEFYSKNTDLKKTLLYYFKIFYYILFIIVLMFLFRKKLYKEIIPYIFVLALILIPNFLIKFIYKKIVDGIGHFKLDVLYIMAMGVIVIIMSALFSALTYIIKDNINETV